MSELAKTYEFTKIEPYWYDQWLQREAFRPKENVKETYSIVIPPPNVTGVLHMGHLLNNTLQDILIRRARLEGKSALWIPGTDHAGLATQVQVERALKKEGKTKHDMSREEFMQKILDWCEKHGGTIIRQLKRMGCSCDWRRTEYTMNPAYHRGVLTAFVKLYEKGLIYRAYRMVNWDPVSLTGLSDEEVVMKEVEGVMVHMKYELVELPGEFIEIKTTRPETIMGDTAVAVNPKHPLYAKYIGKHVWRPFPRAQIPVLADDAADLEFGTGALKVTPAHDRTDWEIGLRHKLEVIDVMNPDATMNEKAGTPFAGMTREKARVAAIEELKKINLLIDVKKYPHSVGHSERTGIPIETRLSMQWWLKYPKVEEARAAVGEGKPIRFYPHRWEKVYDHWLKNIQDWCISRQVIWGQRIPVWYRKGADRNDPKNCHVSVDGPADLQNWEQETDVLDTWASSWIWPLATLGWPDEAEMKKRGFDKFYPTTTLVTAPEIIFFWVARMIIAGLYFKNEIPFRSVYFTGIVRDETGRKMSKSLGNSVDPLELFEKYGADGTRFGLIRVAPTGQDIAFNEESVELGRNFCTKLWNASRFRQMQGAREVPVTLGQILLEINNDKMDAWDHAILQQLRSVSDRVHQCLEEFEFARMANILHSFVWNDFCDTYMEAVKARLKDETQKKHILAIQDFVLRHVYQLLHPIMPHITEELWQKMGFTEGGKILQDSAILNYKDFYDFYTGKPLSVDPLQEGFVNAMNDLIGAGRQLKADNGQAAKRDSEFVLKTSEVGRLEPQREVLERFLGAKSLEFTDSDVPNAPARVTPLGTLYLIQSAAATTPEEKAKLAKELEKLQGFIASAQAKLANESFTAKAPTKVIDDMKATLSQNQAKAEEMKRLLG